LGRLGTASRQLDETRSIIEHLRMLLNTRHGDAPAAPDFGIIDFTDAIHDVPDSIPHIQQSIRRSILDYEPRLRNVSVRHVPTGQPLELSFEVVARLDDKRRTLLRMRTRMTPDGRIAID
jgi:type VI secretion system protein